MKAVQQLCGRAAPYLRAGIGWQDVMFLAQLPSVSGCSLGAETTEERRQLAVSIILDGVRRSNSLP